MRDEHHGAFVLVERFRDNRDVAEVYVVGRLVEDEESRLLEHEARERYETFLTFRQGSDLLAHGLSKQEEACRNLAHLLLVRLLHRGDKRLTHGVLEIERGEVLAVVANLHAACDLCARRSAFSQGFKERCLADTVRAFELEVLLLPKRDVRLLLFRLVRLRVDDGERGYGKEIAEDILLRWDNKGADGLILAAHLHLLLLHLLDLVTHLLCDEAHLAALLREEVRLVLVVLDLLRELRVLAILALDTSGDFLEEVEVRAHVLLYLFRMDIEVEDAVRKRVQELCIVRDNETGLLVALEEPRKVLDACGIKVVRRLVQEKQVRVLDKSGREQETCLLTARERGDDAVVVGLQVHHLEHLIDLWVDVVYLLGEALLEECTHG